MAMYESYIACGCSIVQFWLCLLSLVFRGRKPDDISDHHIIAKLAIKSGNDSIYIFLGISTPVPGVDISRIVV